MRVLFVTHGSDLYGASRSLLELVADLRTRGVEPFFAVPGEGPLVERLDALRIPHAIVPIRPWAAMRRWEARQLGRLAANALAVAALRRHARAFRAELVYTNSSIVPAGALAARSLGLPHVWHLREFGREDYGLRYWFGFPATARLVGRLSARVIAISAALERKYAPFVEAGKLVHVPNPVTLTRSIQPLAELTQLRRTARLVVVGLLHPAKGQLEAIRALAALRGRGHAPELVLAGGADPVYRETLRDTAAALGLHEQVRFAGYVNGSERVLEESDIALVCSRAEAFGRTTAEAMLAGRAVVGGAAGGTRELVRDGATGLLYPPGDPEALAARIARLLEEPGLARRLGAAARAEAEVRFRPRDIGERVFAFLVAARPPPSAALREPFGR